MHGTTSNSQGPIAKRAANMEPLRMVAVAAGLVVALALPLTAHHSFSAEFDATKQVTLDGQVVMMEWVNPHSWLHIDVKKPDGTVERWKIEGGSPSVLLRLGWDRNSVPAGTRVTVVGFQAKDGSLRASSRELRFPDGRRLDLGGSGSSTIDPKK
jgi:uncharacterized protein DUF6152